MFGGSFTQELEPRVMYRTISLVGGMTEEVFLGTWNLNSLSDKLNMVLGMGFSILALQETRIDSRKAQLFANSADSSGYQLLFGKCPVRKKKGCGKVGLRHKQCPGVAIAIKKEIPAHVGPSPTRMEYWHEQGRFLAVNFFDGTAWRTFWNVYAPDDPQKNFQFLSDLAADAQEVQPHSIAGDFNSPLQRGSDMDILFVDVFQIDGRAWSRCFYVSESSIQNKD